MNGPFEERTWPEVADLDRGEVVLIFAGLGRELGLLPPPVFAALIVTVFATALASPALLGWLSRRSRAGDQATREG